MEIKRKRHIVAGGAAPAVGSYPHALEVGKLLFLSGIGPRPPGGGLPAGVTLGADDSVLDYDFGTQCHAVFSNVRAVLESAGASLGDLVDVTVFLTDIERDFGTFNRIWGEYFPQEAPCRTTVEVTRLPTPIAIELKCIAYIED